MKKINKNIKLIQKTTEIILDLVAGIPPFGTPSLTRERSRHAEAIANR